MRHTCYLQLEAVAVLAIMPPMLSITWKIYKNIDRNQKCETVMVRLNMPLHVIQFILCTQHSYINFPTSARSLVAAQKKTTEQFWPFESIIPEVFH